VRIVLDTNVYVSGTIMSHGPSFEILEAWRRRQLDLLISEAILAEIERVLRYPRLRERYAITERDIQRLLYSLRSDAIVLAGYYQVQRSVDPQDDMFLACGLEGQADFIVSGDPHLLALKEYHGIRIVTPRQLATALTRPERSEEERP